MDKKLLIAALSALTVGSGAAVQEASAQSAEERAAYAAALADGSIEALQEFLILYPNSAFTAQVFEELNARISEPPPSGLPPLIDPTQRLPALDFSTGETPTTTIY